MGAVIGDSLPRAIGVAVSPVSIIAGIPMLVGDLAKADSLVFPAPVDRRHRGRCATVIVPDLLGGEDDAFPRSFRSVLETVEASPR